MSQAVEHTTQRKREQEALRQSQNGFRSLADAMPLLIWQCNQEGKCDYFNKGWLQFTGRTMEQELGDGWTQGVHPEDVPRVMQTFLAALSRREPFQFEYRLRHHSGENRWIFDQGVPWFDPQGQFLGYIGGCLDITEQKRAEETLRQNERFIKSVAEASPHWLYVFDFDTMGLVYANRPIMHDLGYPQTDDAATNQLATFRAYMPPDELPHLARLLDEWQAMPDGAVRDDEYFLQHADGTVHSFAGRELVFARRPDNSVRQILGSLLDITARKKAEEALHAVSAELQRILDTAATGLTHCSGDLRYVSVNLAHARWLGLPMERIVGRPIVDVIGPAAFEVIRPYVERVMQGERVEYEAELPLADGVKPIHVVYTPDLNASGQVVGWVASVTDISRRRQVERELLAAKARAEKAQLVAESASRAKDHFVAVLSHELRNPLTPVLPALAAIEKLIPEEGREFLEIARRNVELEARLIDDLLDVTRIASGKIELDRKVVDLGTILHRAAEVCRADIEARQLRFGIKIEDGPHSVHADSARLQQVFWNLIKNAVKFTPHGGSVDVRCWREDGHVIVQVADSGQGIASEALLRLFDAFEQESRATTRQFGGLGLGLAISKALVEMHGGTIQGYSAGKGQGATFTVTLPLPELQATEKPTTPHSIAPIAPRNKLRILLVEDHGDTVRVMRRLLSAEGHQVQTAGDVATALELAAREEFDVLLSDLGLPDGSGHDLMRELLARGRRLPGIALSGYGMADDVQKTLEAGFLEHLTKPVNFDVLLAALNRAAGPASA
jgi:PAS domain S-box-containing protein